MINIEKMGKLRAFVVDKNDRKSISGVRVTLSAGCLGAPNPALVPLASLTSDRSGYVSFNIDRIVKHGLSEVPDLTLEVDGDVSSRMSIKQWLGIMDVRSGPEALPPPKQPKIGCVALTLVTEHRAPAQAGESACKCDTPISGTSVQDADGCDYELSPESFVVRTAIRTGEGDCERITTATVPVRSYAFSTVVLRSVSKSDKTAMAVRLSHWGSRMTPPPAESRLLATADPVPLPPVDVNTWSPSAGLRFGEILEYEQQWFSLGHSLGEIKYSLALAPGEATQIAVIDWSRSDAILRTDNVLATEDLKHKQQFDRQIDEAVNAALAEYTRGQSTQAGIGAAAAGKIGDFNIGANAALGGAEAKNWGNRDLSGESLQDVHATVVQATNLSRSLTSSVVIQATQNESNKLVTRAVANHNHCHSLTILYYEVLRHLRMRTALRRRRWAILIPFSMISFTGELIGDATILRFRSALEPNLLEPERAQCFDALERLLADDYYDWPSGYSETGVLLQNGGNPSPTGTNNDGSNTTAATEDIPVSSFDLTLRTTSANFGSTWGEIVVHVMDMKKGEWVEIWKKPPVILGTGGVELKNVEFPQNVPVAGWLAKNLGNVRVGWREANSMDSWEFAGITLKCRLGDKDKSEFMLVNTNGKSVPPGSKSKENAICRFDDSVAITWSPELQASKYQPAPKTSMPVSDPADPAQAEAIIERRAKARRTSDKRAVRRLRAHLAANIGYYSRVVWMSMDSSERRLALENALGGFPDLLDAIDDRPVAVSGNHVAFAYTGDAPAWLSKLGQETPPPEESIITFPTPGIFAEAQLGHCNACEERDVTRMWNWAELPTEQLPQMQGISPGPRGQMPSVEPAQLPTNVLNVVAPPAAPDPVGLAAAISAVTKGDSFRDMSGLAQVSDLLGKLASGAVDLVKGQQQLQKAAADAKQKVDSAMVGQGTRTISQPRLGGQDVLDLATGYRKAGTILGLSPETSQNNFQRRLQADVQPAIYAAEQQAPNFVLASGGRAPAPTTGIGGVIPGNAGGNDVAIATVKRWANGLMDYVPKIFKNMEKDPEKSIGERLGDATIKVVKDEALSTLDKEPLFHAFRKSVEYTLAFVDGVGAQMDKARVGINTVVAAGELAIGNSADGLSPADIEAIKKSRQWQALATQELQGILENGLSDMVSKMISDQLGPVAEKLSTMTKGLSDLLLNQGLIQVWELVAIGESKGEFQSMPVRLRGVAVRVMIGCLLRQLATKEHRNLLLRAIAPQATDEAMAVAVLQAISMLYDDFERDDPLLKTFGNDVVISNSAISVSKNIIRAAGTVAAQLKKDFGYVVSETHGNGFALPTVDQSQKTIEMGYAFIEAMDKANSPTADIEDMLHSAHDLQLAYDSLGDAAQTGVMLMATAYNLEMQAGGLVSGNTLNDVKNAQNAVNEARDELMAAYDQTPTGSLIAGLIEPIDIAGLPIA